MVLIYFGYLTDFPSRQNAAPGHFIEGSHAQIENPCTARQKNAWSRQYSPIGAPQALSHKLRLPEQVLLEGTAS